MELYNIDIGRVAAKRLKAKNCCKVDLLGDAVMKRVVPRRTATPGGPGNAMAGRWLVSVCDE